jgi:hypothetical protein
MPFSGALSTIASLTRSFAGTLGTMTGTASRKVGKSLSGALGTLSGTVSTQLVDLQDVSGTLPAMSGSLSRVVSYTKSVGGTLEFDGTAFTAASYARTLAGTLSFGGGTVDAVGEVIGQTVAGALPAMSGSVSTVYTENAVVISSRQKPWNGTPWESLPWKR